MKICKIAWEKMVALKNPQNYIEIEFFKRSPHALLAVQIIDIIDYWNFKSMLRKIMTHIIKQTKFENAFIIGLISDNKFGNHICHGVFSSIFIDRNILEEKIKFKNIAEYTHGCFLEVLERYRKELKPSHFLLKIVPLKSSEGGKFIKDDSIDFSDAVLVFKRWHYKHAKIKYA